MLPCLTDWGRVLRELTRSGSLALGPGGMPRGEAGGVGSEAELQVGAGAPAGTLPALNGRVSEGVWGLGPFPHPF